MITRTANSNPAMWEMRGLSTDTKPVDGVPNGSVLYIMDAKKKSLSTTMYMFDEQNKEWLPQ